MEASFIPRKTSTCTKNFDLLCVYSDRPLGSFVKTLIQQHVLGAIPGKPVWQSIHGQAIRLSAREAFSHRQCKKAQLTLTTSEFQNMLTG